MTYEVRQVYAYNYGDEGWTYDSSIFLFNMNSKAQNVGAALRKALCNYGIAFVPHKTMVSEDCDAVEIISRKTKEPLFVAIPQL